MDRKKLYIRIALTIVALILLFNGIKGIVNDTKEYSYELNKNSINNEGIVGEILKDVEIKQEIQGTKEFQGVQILFATYSNHNLDSEYNIKIIDDKNVAIYDEDVNAKEFEDNSYYNIVLDKKYNFEGKKVAVIITGKNATSGNALTIWKSNEDSYKNANLFIDNEETEGDIVFNVITSVEEKSNTGIMAYKILFLTLGIAFICVNIWIDIKKLYNFIFKYRVVIALILFVFMVANKLHFSSIGMYDTYIQPGRGTEFASPIFGEARAIRSDEWLVSTPRKLTTAYAGVSGKNSIPMAMEMNSITATGVELGWSALANPLLWGYYTGDTEIGISFYWNAFLIFAFLFSFEMCLIISNRNRILSLIGACLLTFSSYYLWWSGAANWLLPGQAAIVLLYYAINAKKKWSRLLYGIGTAIAGASFVVILYPAWQVPAGYMLLIILIWMVIKAWETIKKFDIKDWMIIAGCILLMVSIIVAFFISNSEYTSMITKTVYPGERVSNGGDTWSKLFNYIGGWLFGIEEIANPSEAGIVLNLFPLPIIMGIIYMIKNKKLDGLILSMIIFSAFLTVYCSVGIPMWLSKVTLMSRSTAIRAVDVLAVIQLYLFILVAGRMNEEKKLKRLTAYVITFAVVLFAAYKFNVSMPTYFDKYELIAISVVLTLCVAPWITKSKRMERVASAVIICSVTVATGIQVLPVMKGLDVIYSKPVAQEIADIVEEDEEGKWICIDSIVASGYTIACGAPTINSTNFIPNYELWEILDPEGKYEEYYNRYAHIGIVLTEGETEVKLIQADHIVVSLAYDDMEKIAVKYIYSGKPLKGSENVELQQLYNEYDSYIYKVIYN